MANIIEELFGISTESVKVDPNLENIDWWNYGYYESSSVELNYKEKPLYCTSLNYDSWINM